MKHIISLGAGWQSSRMALGAARGEIKPMPDAAIFADTGWEPQAVYDYLEFLEDELPFPVYRVRTDSSRYEGLTLRDQVMRATLQRKWDGRNWRDNMPMPIPVFVQDNGSVGMTRRQCTRDWKIRPIEKFSKKLLGLKPGFRLPTEPILTQWIGISMDEAQRMKPSREAWKTHRYPLVFELQERRADCMAWIEKHGYPRPPRSACIGCPYHDDYEWWQIKQNPEEWADAVECDKKIRHAGGKRGDAFLHHSGRPLVEAVPDEEPKRKEDRPVNLLLFNECEGMCGV